MVIVQAIRGQAARQAAPPHRRFHVRTESWWHASIRDEALRPSPIGTELLTYSARQSALRAAFPAAGASCTPWTGPQGIPMRQTYRWTHAGRARRRYGLAMRARAIAGAHRDDPALTGFRQGSTTPRSACPLVAGPRASRRTPPPKRCCASPASCERCEARCEQRPAQRGSAPRSPARRRRKCAACGRLRRRGGRPDPPAPAGRGLPLGEPSVCERLPLQGGTRIWARSSGAPGARLEDPGKWRAMAACAAGFNCDKKGLP